MKVPGRALRPLSRMRPGRIRRSSSSEVMGAIRHRGAISSIDLLMLSSGDAAVTTRPTTGKRLHSNGFRRARRRAFYLAVSRSGGLSPVSPCQTCERPRTIHREEMSAHCLTAGFEGGTKSPAPRKSQSDRFAAGVRSSCISIDAGSVAGLLGKGATNKGAPASAGTRGPLLGVLSSTFPLANTPIFAKYRLVSSGSARPVARYAA